MCTSSFCLRFLKTLAKDASRHFYSLTAKKSIQFRQKSVHLHFSCIQCPEKMTKTCSKYSRIVAQDKELLYLEVSTEFLAHCAYVHYLSKIPTFQFYKKLNKIVHTLKKLSITEKGNFKKDFSY
jgi:hypothetical protein